MIFLSIVSSWTGALVYDRTQKKKIQQKWCTLVEHIAQETLPTNHLARKVTIILAAPPGDGLRAAREHFTEYVKPVLVAGSLDWDVIEGRREGDVRAGLAEKIRRLRRKHGEFAETSVELDTATAYENVRARTGIREFDGVKGDIVIGRHTWKEYVRGLHEGWLGSIDPPKEPESEAEPAALLEPSVSQDLSPLDAPSQTEDASSPSTVEAVTKEEPKEEAKEEPKKPLVAPPHNNPDSYSSSPLPQSIPHELTPSTPIPYPHILGFLKTPIRIYRFLNRRHLADDVGRQTAAAVLAAYRPWREESGAGDADDAAGGGGGSVRHWEQQDVLAHEEGNWSKASKQRKDGEGERVWLDEMIIDPRIGQRMKKFEVEPWEEERARAIWNGSKGLPGRREEGEQLDKESQQWK